jgi:hypothetical protein
MHSHRCHVGPLTAVSIGFAALSITVCFQLPHDSFFTVQKFIIIFFTAHGLGGV